MASICSIHCTCATAESEATNTMKENCEMCTSATESVQQASSFSMKLNSEHSSEEDISSEDLSTIETEKIAVIRRIKKLQTEKELQELQQCDRLAPVSN
ncbi:hypothetical protein I7I48_07364 [Histoplasma ohiense]|nr:hypothetical protein I7I48_07364 [Histoplasma ohiense (nom. inval.)]